METCGLRQGSNVLGPVATWASDELGANPIPSTMPACLLRRHCSFRLLVDGKKESVDSRVAASALVFVLSLSIGPACSDGGGNKGGIPCVADGVCQPACAADPDCAGATVADAGVDSAYTCEEVGESLKQLLELAEYDSCSETGIARPASTECAVASQETVGELRLLGYGVANSTNCRAESLRADADVDALLERAREVAAGTSCQQPIADVCFGGIAPGGHMCLQGHQVMTMVPWCLDGSCDIADVCSCADRIHFIGYQRECDGVPDCPDGSDEIGCVAPGECPAFLSICFGKCVDTRVDPLNCGSCGHMCPPTEAGASCQEGQCECLSGYSECGSTCVNTQTDTNNCGGCGNRCPSDRTCFQGQCQCPPALVDCGDSCADIAVDFANCGGCGKICSTGYSCQGAKCVPASGVVIDGGIPNPLSQ